MNGKAWTSIVLLVFFNKRKWDRYLIEGWKLGEKELIAHSRKMIAIKKILLVCSIKA